MRFNHFVLLTFMFMLANNTAKAQSSTATSSASTSSTVVSKNKLSGKFSFGGRSDFQETSSSEKSYSSEYEIALGYQTDAENSFSLNVPFEKELSGAYEARFQLDTRLSHTRADLYQYKNLNLSFKSSLVYPTTEISKLEREMVAGFELSPIFSFDLNKYATGLGFIYIPRYRKDFHKYTVDRSGNQISEQSFLHIFVLNYNFWEKYTFQSALVYVNSWRYDGAQGFDSYLTVQELSAQITPKLGLTLGLETAAALVNPERGESNGIQIFDKEVSQVYGKASVVF